MEAAGQGEPRGREASSGRPTSLLPSPTRLPPHRQAHLTGEGSGKFSLSLGSSSKSQAPSSTITISGGGINDVAASPDGRQLAAACRDGALRLVDLGTGTVVAGFTSYYGALLCCAFSPDGGRLWECGAVGLWGWGRLFLNPRTQRMGRGRGCRVVAAGWVWIGVVIGLDGCRRQPCHHPCGRCAMTSPRSHVMPDLRIFPLPAPAAQASTWLRAARTTWCLCTGWRSGTQCCMARGTGAGSAGWRGTHGA